VIGAGGAACAAHIASPSRRPFRRCRRASADICRRRRFGAAPRLIALTRMTDMMLRPGLLATEGSAYGFAQYRVEENGAWQRRWS